MLGYLKPSIYFQQNNMDVEDLYQNLDWDGIFLVRI